MGNRRREVGKAAFVEVEDVVANTDFELAFQDMNGFFLQVVNVQRRPDAGETMRYGLATLCMGVGQGEATLIELAADDGVSLAPADWLAADVLSVEDFAVDDGVDVLLLPFPPPPPPQAVSVKLETSTPQ